MPRLNKDQKKQIRNLYLVHELDANEIRDKIGLSKSSQQVHKYIEDEGLKDLRRQVMAKTTTQTEEGVNASEKTVIDRLGKAGLTPNDARNAVRRAQEVLLNGGNDNPTEDEMFMAAVQFIGSGTLIQKTTDTGRTGVAVMTPSAAQAPTTASKSPNSASRHLKNATMKPKG